MAKPQHVKVTVCQGYHQTLGLPGYPAEDLCAPHGTLVFAVEAGTIVKLSGHPPSEGWVQGVGGPFGWSIYLHGDRSGTTYYITHLGSRTVHLGQHVHAGQVIGTVGNMPSERPDHIHVGVHGGTVTWGQLGYLYWFGKGAEVTAPPLAPPPTSTTKVGAEASVESSWRQLMRVLGADWPAWSNQSQTARRGITREVE